MFSLESDSKVPRKPAGMAPGLTSGMQASVSKMQGLNQGRVSIRVGQGRRQAELCGSGQRNQVLEHLLAASGHHYFLARLQHP